MGTGIGLAGFLFWLGLRFSAETKRSIEQAVHRTTDEVSKQAGERERELRTRLDDLQVTLEQRLQEHAAGQDERVALLAQEPTFENLTGLLTEANKLEAFDNGRITVHASGDPDGLALRFSWHFNPDERERPQGPHLDIEVRTQDEVKSPTRRRVITLEWLPSESAVDVAEKVVARLREAGLWQGRESLDWQLALKNLQQSINVGMAARRRDGGAWPLTGSLVELVGDDWAITTNGLVCRSRNFSVAGGRLDRKLPFPQSGPDWADPDEWYRVVSRARTVFPRTYEVPQPGQGTWRPWVG
ncbi:hypothetical protein JIG36_49835 [Actinoplanes sp. LDG1-06]|uniref:Uncharacterized protein n=1 Tax=Paractinoplanes ovalisporus TaxID=2810368 RepID=A0ABS2AUR4_9ACTN|nr:hypothetical protein [Actinoplanes ovalisporus]MBM2623617.1 hypothetical protein [Actinoplanes ovalisporus]